MNIVDRCRAWHKPGEAITGDVQLYLDAANEIERLQEYKRKQMLDIIDLGEAFEKLEIDNGKLRAALEDIADSPLGVAAETLRKVARAALNGETK